MRSTTRFEAATTPNFREELGDLLLQVLFHAVLAEERNAFTMSDVAADSLRR
jgi:NTP pyrophosphatase (non-canonical NTP hydrolase)